MSLVDPARLASGGNMGMIRKMAHVSLALDDSLHKLVPLGNKNDSL